MIQINQPQIGKEEIEAVVRVMKSGILTHGLGAGPMVTEFENLFGRLVKAKSAIALGSGTAALHSALVAAGVKPSDEVILPSFTFVATAEVIMFMRARPIFVDINPDTYTISADTLKKAITKKTKVIMPVDLYGMPVEMKPIREIADKHGLKIIEDAAQAHGATYMRRPAGAFADAACWSFYGSKNMTTGEGGMITTNDEQITETARCIRSHGEKQKYMSVMLGHNYHMPEMAAAMGCAQTKKLPKFVSIRHKNATRLTKILGKARKLQPPKEPEGFRCSWYLYTVKLKNAKKRERDELVEQLKQKGIGAFVCYENPIHLMPYYHKFRKHRLPVTEKVSKKVFSLPVHPGVTGKQIDFIGETVLRLLK